MTGEHIHEASCIVGNELDELCCLHVISAGLLQQCDRWVVQCVGESVNIFTYSGDDAIELARVAGYDPASADSDPQPYP
jgi:hypothetical protein